jgi:hypothetical protein
MRNGPSILPLLIIALFFFIIPITAQVTPGSKWVWMKGDNIIDQHGIYGAKGIADAANKPGARWGSKSWTDLSGNLWLFGGYGYGAVSGSLGGLNDLWKYEPANNQWTWMSGDSIINQSGLYGTQGVAAAANKPGSRADAASWRDGSGNFWLFGGSAYTGGWLNDLWKYNPFTNQWTWIKGDTTFGVHSVYGIQGVANPGNKPGCRSASSSWMDNSGNLWLFGGSGSDVPSLYLKDLWKYDPTTNQWTWMKGNNVFYNFGTYGTQGIADPANNPHGRWGGVSWTDAQGNLWLFGGYGLTSFIVPGASHYFNDLWKYDPLINQWTWIKGDSTENHYGVYGTQGNPALANMPGSRASGIRWTEPDNLWLFGGVGYAESTGGTTSDFELNDLWKYTISSNQWTWVKGDKSINASGIYGIQGVTDTNNKPGGRNDGTSWMDGTGNIWLFGGGGQGGSANLLNDLWKLGNFCPFSIIITSSANDICFGTPVTFTAVITNGGSTPTYQWQKNGINVGTNSDTYTDVSLNNNDVVRCKLTSADPCVATPALLSNSITTSVNGNSSISSITMYPNPVTKNQVTIRLQNQQEGKYNVRLFNSIGQLIYKTVLNNTCQCCGLTQLIHLPSLAMGGYTLEIIKPDGRRSVEKLIVSGSN